MINENNSAWVCGKISSGFMFRDEKYGERFYTFTLDLKRLSGTVDKIPVTVSERLMDVTMDYSGKYIYVKGEFRSHNIHIGEKGHLKLEVFAQDVTFMDKDEKQVNEVTLKGLICKSPVYRETPLGREITDLLVAVNRPYDKSDYIPCIAWGRNARTASLMDVGARVELTGRIQSREYQKAEKDGNVETKTAYEVSVSAIREGTKA